MYFLAAVLLATLSTVYCETHTLMYIYTTFSKPVNLPGIHEFTAMGLLDDRMIDYYDSTIQKKIPKQPWMKERLEPEYWTKGTTSRQSKEQWFKVNINILMDRMRQNDSDVHILQWRHGCTAASQPDGSLRFQIGDDFLSFDDANMRWIAPVAEAVQTKTKWDNVQILNQYTKGYLQKECVDWLEKFMTYGNEQLEKASPPEVYLLTKRPKTRITNIVLTCMATGFYPKDMVLNIRRNNVVLIEMDGLESTGVLPNEDDTFQIKKSVEIVAADSSNYTCEVIHKLSRIHVVKEWDHHLSDSRDLGPVIGGVVGGVVVVVLVVVLIVLGVVKGMCGRKADTGGAGQEADLINMGMKGTQVGSNPSLDSGLGNGDVVVEERTNLKGSKDTLASDSGSHASGSSESGWGTDSDNVSAEAEVLLGQRA